MNQEEMQRVRSSWAKVIPNDEEFVNRFYDNLFQLDPDLQSLFKRNMGMQGRKLMSMFSTAIEYMDHPEKVVPPLVAAGKRHIHYGVQPQDYEIVRQALMQTLAEELGEKFDDETKLAWELAYNGIQNIMMSACYQRG